MVIKDEGVYINIKGVNNVVTAISKLASEVDKQLAIKMAKAVLIVGRSAKSKAAIDTGYMKANIKGSILRQRSVIIGQIKSKARYSIYQEFGSTQNAAHPFMIPAIRDNETKVREILGEAIIDAASTVGRKYSTSTRREI